MKMASQLKRILGSQIAEVLYPKYGNLNPEMIASQIQITSKKGSLPDFSIPIHQLSKFIGFKENDKLDMILKQELSTSTNSQYSGDSIGMEIDKDILIKEALLPKDSNISYLWKNNIHFLNEKKDTVIVEFSSPNIAKPFHAGHMRSTILGNFISNICNSVGHKVIRLNYIGDWGSQFGVLSKGYQLFGNEDALKTNPIQHLFEVYVLANNLLTEDATFQQDTRAEFRKLENGDERIKSLWQRFCDLSIEDLKLTYERLGIQFDIFEGESMYSLDAIQECNKLKEMGLSVTKADETQVIPIDHPSGQREITLRKSDGTTLYLTRDIAAAKRRQEKYHFGKMFYVVENGQSDHFIALFDIIKQLGLPWYENLVHVKFGRIHGLSTRQGKVVFLKDILDEAKMRTLNSMKQTQTTKVSENLEEVADILGVSAVLVNDMSARRLNDFDFDWRRIIKTKGDSGIFIQYVHARLCSLENNCGIKLDEDCDLKLLKENAAFELISTLLMYEDVCHKAYIELEPCHIVQYLFQLCHAINRTFKVLKVKGEALEVAKVRLLLFVRARHLLADAMETIGLRPLRAM